MSRGTPFGRRVAGAHAGPLTEIVKVPDRGHSLTIDGRWREVVDTALAFVKRFV